MVSNSDRLKEWLQPQQILLDVVASDRSDALRIMADAIGRSHGLDPAPLYRALWRREQAESTAVGDGFAIPHARISGLTRPLTLFMRTRCPIDFLAPDEEPVSDLLAILVPAAGLKHEHLQMLAMVSMLFSDSSFRQRLQTAPEVVSAEDEFRRAIASLPD